MHNVIRKCWQGLHVTCSSSSCLRADLSASVCSCSRRVIWLATSISCSSSSRRWSESSCCKRKSSILSSICSCRSASTWHATKRWTHIFYLGGKNIHTCTKEGILKHFLPFIHKDISSVLKNEKIHQLALWPFNWLCWRCLSKCWRYDSEWTNNISWSPEMS